MAVSLPFWLQLWYGTLSGKSYSSSPYNSNMAENQPWQCDQHLQFFSYIVLCPYCSHLYSLIMLLHCTILYNIVQNNNDGIEIRALFQYLIRHLLVRSRKDSKLRDLYLKLYNRFEIWQVPWQQCCWWACQISKQCDNSNYQSRSFRDFMRSYDKDVLSDIDTGLRLWTHNLRHPISHPHGWARWCVLEKTESVKMGHHCNTRIAWAPSQYKDRLIYVWRFPC